ncbi:MAG: ATP-binding protein [Candidatus Bipolaricaulia bacterium]
MENEHIKVLLIEDNPGDARLIREVLAEVKGASFDLECADRLSIGLEHLAEGGINVVLLDLSLPDSQGIDTFAEVHTQASGVPIVVLTGLDDEALAVKTVHEGAQDYLVKGQLDNHLLVRAMRYAIERKQIDQMKSDFVSMVSHQMRTPVALIMGYIDNMLMGLTGDLTAQQKQYLQEMREISSKNYRLISDLLNVSRIERSVISVDIRPVRLKEVIDLAVRDYHERIKKKGLALNLEEMDYEIIVLADKDKMVDALSNVIDNAVKFTHEGSITIRTKSENGFGIVEVVDTGEGMSDDLLNRLFKRDQIFSGGPTPEIGSGLGLYITKKFMSLQHGDISVTSAVGKGSHFVFKIPLT